MAVFLMVSLGFADPNWSETGRYRAPKCFLPFGVVNAHQMHPCPSWHVATEPSGPVVSASQAILRSEDHEHGRHDARVHPRAAGLDIHKMKCWTQHFIF